MAKRKRFRSGYRTGLVTLPDGRNTGGGISPGGKRWSGNNQMAGVCWGQSFFGLPRAPLLAPSARKTGWRQRQSHLRNKAHRSHYLLLDVRQASRTLYTTPLQGRASPYTINDATMRLCGVDHPASRHPIAAGSRSHSAPPHRTSHWQRRIAISAVAVGGSSVMRAILSLSKR